MSSDNVVSLFSRKVVSDKKENEPLSNEDIQYFLKQLDASLETFFEMSPHEKFSLYRTLVEFTHTSMEVMFGKEMKGEE